MTEQKTYISITELEKEIKKYPFLTLEVLKKIRFFKNYQIRQKWLK